MFGACLHFFSNKCGGEKEKFVILQEIIKFWVINMDYGKFLEKLTTTALFPPLAHALATEQEQRKEVEIEFVKEVVVDVNTRLTKLESIVDKEYMGTDDFKNFFHKTLLKAAIDLRMEKKKMFANIIVNSTLVGNANTKDRWKYLYAETIDKIDEDLFAFLLRIKSRCISKGHELDLGWTGKEPELSAMGYDLATFRTNADYLMSTGLMTRIHLERFGDNDGVLNISDEYYVTEFGAGFVEYVREHDVSEEADAEVVE